MDIFYKKKYIKALKEKKYFFSLLPEEGPKVCRYSSCSNKTVKYSLFCAKHHFEMVTRLPCPWIVSEDGTKVIKVLSYYVMNHVSRFAKTGAKIGIMLWLIQGLVIFYSQGHFGMSLWLLFFFVLWGRTFFSRELARQVLPIKYILPSFVIVSGIHAINITLWNVMLTAWKAHLITMGIGSILGVFPGMVIGYVVGAIRNKKQNPPHEDPTGRVWIKGFLLPTSVFSILFILYTRYGPSLSDIFKVAPQ